MSYSSALINPVILAAAIAGMLASIAAAKSRVQSNQPYVTCLGGVFYARAIPDEETGAKGTTTIYRVRRNADEVIERHAWFAPGGVHLGWSPIAGKVATLARHTAPAKDPADQVEVRFYLGSELLSTYTTTDLIKLGAQLDRGEESSGRMADLRVTGCGQIAGTNEYVFRVVLHNGTAEKTIDFDVLTGKPYDAATAATRPAHD